MDVACSLSRSNVLYGGEVARCNERLNSTSLKYRRFHCKSFGGSRLFSKANSPKNLKKNNADSVSLASTRIVNEGNFWLWCYGSNGSSFYDSGNIFKFSKHVGLIQCQSNESVAYVNGNGRDAEAIETGENGATLESNTSGERSGEEEGFAVPRLDELRESLQKALKELEDSRLSSTMFEEKAQSISETAIALKDEAANAWNHVNIALGSIQEIVNEEAIAKEVVQKATVALSFAEARLQVAVDSLRISKEKNESSEESGREESIEEEALLDAQQEIKECQDDLANCEAELERVQSRKEELQKELDRLNLVAEQAQIKASKAEEDVANIMLLAEQAVACELEAAQRVDDAVIALQRAEKNLQLSSVGTFDSSVDGTSAEEASLENSADSVVAKDWEMPAEVAELLEPSDGQLEEPSLSDESDKENGKVDVELLKDTEAEAEKLKSIQTKVQEMQKDSTRESSLSAPKALLKKSSRFFSASFFSFPADEEEFTPASVLHGILGSAKKQLPKLIFGSLLVGAGYA